MQLYDMFDYGQPQSESTLSAPGRAIHLREPVENEGQVFGIDSLSGVADDQQRFALQSFEANLDQAALGRELDGVRKQVPDDLFQALLIAVERPDPGFEHDLHSQTLRLDRRADGVDGGLDYRHQFDRAVFEGQFTGGDARGVEQVADQVGLRFRVALDGQQRPFGRGAV